MKTAILNFILLKWSVSVLLAFPIQVFPQQLQLGIMNIGIPVFLFILDSPYKERYNVGFSVEDAGSERSYSFKLEMSQ